MIIPFICAILTTCTAAKKNPYGNDFSVYKNNNNNIIKISSGMLIVDSHEYYGSDCSTRKYKCINYDGFITLSVPKMCDLLAGSWTIDSTKFNMVGIYPHIGVTVGTPSNYYLIYTVSGYPTIGIVNIQYDKKHQFRLYDHRGSRSKAYYARSASMWYHKISGPSLMGCH